MSSFRPLSSLTVQHSSAKKQKCEIKASFWSNRTEQPQRPDGDALVIDVSGVGRFVLIKAGDTLSNAQQLSDMNFLDTTNKQTPTSGANTDQTGHTGSNSRGFMDRVNNAVGGGQTGEQNEDLLDKGVDMFQQKVMGAGDQSNESAIEQAKDEQISDAIRRGYKSTTGGEMPIKDKT